MTKTMKCRFCSAPSIAIFELTSLDGYSWEVPLCIDDALIIQNQGYSVKVKKVKNGEKKNEEMGRS